MIKIKFRVWNKGMGMSFPTSDAWYNLKNGEFELPKETILMQSTGLFDHNGKEIYDGDLISWKDWERGGGGYSNIISEVLWDDDKSQWAILNHCKDNLAKFIKTTTDFQIVGNIYENKELLKE